MLSTIRDKTTSALRRRAAALLGQTPCNGGSPSEARLYILLRGDLALTPGETIAAGVETAVQFAFETQRLAPQLRPNDARHAAFRDWAIFRGASSCGDVDIRAVDADELLRVATGAKARGLAAGVTVDPTYPYPVPFEVLNLLDARLHTASPAVIQDGALCFRAENTGGYLFGATEAVNSLLDACKIRRAPAQGPQRLVVFTRSDLPSMNLGKAVAQAAHAGNHFLHEAVGFNAAANDAPAAYAAWSQSTTQGFGTTITLDAGRTSLVDFAAAARRLGADAGVNEDPRFGYTLPNELAALIDPARHTAAPKRLADGATRLFRRETVAAWAFGDAAVLAPLLGALPLY